MAVDSLPQFLRNEQTQSYALSGSAPIPKEAAIAQALSLLNSAIGDMNHFIDTLEKRLTTVMTPAMPSAAQTGGVLPQTPNRSALADDLSVARSAVIFASTRIADLTSRIEL